MQAIAQVVESLGMFGFLILAIKWLIEDAQRDREFLDGLRKEERSTREQRDDDIIEDWKRMRNLE